MLSLQSHEPQGQRIRQHQTHPAILSLSILCPEIAVQRWQMGLQVLHSQHSKGVPDLCSVLSCCFHPPLTCCCSSKSPLPQLDPREQNLLVPGTATKPDLQNWAVTILSNFCYKHILLNRAQFSKARDVLVIWTASPRHLLLSENASHHLCGNSWCSALAGAGAEPCSQAVPAFGGGEGHPALIPCARSCPTISTARPRQPRVSRNKVGALGCLDQVIWDELGALGYLWHLPANLGCRMALPSKGGSHKQSLCSPAGSDFTSSSKAFLQLKADFYLPHQVAYGVLLPARLRNLLCLDPSESFPAP